MPKSIPQNNSYPWGEQLSRHLSQMNAPPTGGINAWDNRPDPSSLGTEDEGLIGYDREEGELIRWNGQEWETLASNASKENTPPIYVWDDSTKPTNPELNTSGYNKDNHSIEVWDGTDWQEYPLYTENKVSNWNNDTRPENPNIGTIGLNTDENELELWDGERWRPIAPSYPEDVWKIIDSNEDLRPTSNNFIDPKSGPKVLNLPPGPLPEGTELNVVTSPDTTPENNVTILGNGFNINGENSPYIIGQPKEAVTFVYLPGYGWVTAVTSSEESDPEPNEGFPVFTPKYLAIDHTRGTIVMPDGEGIFVNPGVIDVPESYIGTQDNKLWFNPDGTFDIGLSDSTVPEDSLLILTFDVDGEGYVHFDYLLPKEGRFYLSGTNFTVTEGEPWTVLPLIRRVGGVEGHVQVTIQPTPGTAPVRRYNTSPIILDFENEQITKSFSVPIVNDNIYDGDQTFKVLVQSVTAGEVGEPKEAEVTIIENNEQIPDVTTPTMSSSRSGFRAIAMTINGGHANEAAGAFIRNEFEVATNTGFTSGRAAYNSTSDSRTTGNLSWNTLYYVRGRRVYENTTSDWTPMTSVQTLPAPYVSTPGRPSTSITSHRVMNISMNRGSGNVTAGSFVRNEFQVATNSSFSSGVLTYTSTSNSRSTGNLSYGTTYYVRVRSVYQNATSSWSSSRNEATAAAPYVSTPGTPSTSISNYRVINMSMNTGSGNASAGGFVKNEFQVARNSSFTSGVIDYTSTGTSTSTGNLSYNTTYYVRVRSVYDNATSSWSSYATRPTSAPPPPPPPPPSPSPSPSPPSGPLRVSGVAMRWNVDQMDWRVWGSGSGPAHAPSWRNGVLMSNYGSPHFTPTGNWGVTGQRQRGHWRIEVIPDNGSSSASGTFTITSAHPGSIP